jgi:hypothetical protein
VPEPTTVLMVPAAMPAARTSRHCQTFTLPPSAARTSSGAVRWARTRVQAHLTILILALRGQVLGARAVV